MKECTHHTQQDDWGLTLGPNGDYQLQLINPTKIKEEESPNAFAKPIFLNLMRILVTDNHTRNGGELKRQVVRIPMGSPVSPHIANLFRYAVKAKLVEDLVAVEIWVEGLRTDRRDRPGSLSSLSYPPPVEARHQRGRLGVMPYGFREVVPEPQERATSVTVLGGSHSWIGSRFPGARAVVLRAGWDHRISPPCGRTWTLPDCK